MQSTTPPGLLARAKAQCPLPVFLLSSPFLINTHWLCQRSCRASYRSDSSSRLEIDPRPRDEVGDALVPQEWAPALLRGDRLCCVSNEAGLPFEVIDPVLDDQPADRRDVLPHRLPQRDGLS